MRELRSVARKHPAALQLLSRGPVAAPGPKPLSPTAPAADLPMMKTATATTRSASAVVATHDRGVRAAPGQADRAEIRGQTRRPHAPCRLVSTLGSSVPGSLTGGTALPPI